MEVLVIITVRIMVYITVTNYLTFMYNKHRVHNIIITRKFFFFFFLRPSVTMTHTDSALHDIHALNYNYKRDRCP